MEFLGGWNKEEDDEEGDGIILVFFFFGRNFRFGFVLCFCAFVYCFGLVWFGLVLCLRLLFWFGFGLCCACDIEEDGRRKS